MSQTGFPARFDHMDPFAAYVFNNLSSDMLDSLTDEQIEALAEAIARQRGAGRHAAEIRGLIPLFFARYYYVILVGRDRRSKYDAVPHQRRKKANWLANILLVVLLSPAILIVMVAVLYAIKVAFGLNLIPGFHLPDYLVLP